MNRRRSLISILLCAAIVLAGCQKNQKSKKEDPISIELYNTAAAAVQTENSYTLSIAKDKTTTIGDTVTEESIIQTVTYQNLDEDNFVAYVSEAITVNKDTLELKYSYTGNQAKMLIDNRAYEAELSPEDFIAHFAPAVLLDTTLYKTTEASKSDGITMFSFSDATGAEQWAMPASASVLDAHGNATLDKDGNLISSSYHISYTNGAASVLDKTTVTISPATEQSYIDDIESTQITSFFAPKQLELACMYLKNTSDISSEIVHIIGSEAFSVGREQTTQLSFSGMDNELKADIAATITQQEHGSRKEPVVMVENIHFEDGTYTISVNNEEQIAAAYSPDQMRKDCIDLLIGNIPAIGQLSAISSEVSESQLQIKFRTTSYLSDTICQQISNSLYGDPTFISGISTSISPAEATGYLTIDLQTGLPIASGILYETTHTVDDKEYKLTSQVDQNYSITE